MKWDFSSIRIKSFKDILDYHNIIHKEDMEQNKSVSEWRCLLNILKKLHDTAAIPELMCYPFTISKNEEPDFVIDYVDRELLVEISKITTQRIEYVRHKTEKTGNPDADYEEIASLYHDSRPSKDENIDLIRQPGDHLVEEGIYGAYPEKRWAEICVQVIKRKSKLQYSKTVDILILDDFDYPWSDLKHIENRYKILREMIIDNDLQRLKILPNIFANTLGKLGMIRIDNIWHVEALELRHVPTLVVF